MKYSLLPLLFFLILVNAATAQKKSPDDFLGYELGTHFTSHQKMLDYVKYLADEEKNIKLVPYGKTYEGRELMVLIVSSEENIENLESIRTNNLALSKASKRVIDVKKQPAILWMSYNVHGNEASSTETAMKVLFSLTAGQTKSIKDWLKNTVVIIDPCLNPDGRERYVNYFNSVSGSEPNANPEAREHHEPWPRGRSNHYYFDLNRDWAWQTQIETQQRLALYHEWMPEVHVDFHEQSYNEPYYFAPAAEPVHQDITAFQRAFQVTVGKNNAKYFDEQGWRYFTKERFDLLYPSYGDTYPLYNGAIGMTYEQGGINAGLSVVTNDGDTLTLKDRISHHYSTSLSTLEVVAANSIRLVGEFKKYFENSVLSPPGVYQTFVVKADNQDKIKRMTDLLVKNHIEYAFGSDKTINGFNYETQVNSNYKIQRNDLIINLHQPAAVLANVLFEPKTFVTDSNTYDITAWALPYAFGLNAFAAKESVKGMYPSMEIKKEEFTKLKKPFAWILPWNSIEDVKVLIALQEIGIKVRLAEQGFTIDGVDYKEGSLLIYRIENEKNIKDLASKIEVIEQRLHKRLNSTASGFVEKGSDFGASTYSLLKTPKVAVLSGLEISSQSVGEIWHFFEQELHYPLTMIEQDDINGIDLNKFNVLILPDGTYSKMINEKKIDDWLAKGGKIILMEDAIASIIGKKPFLIKKKEASKSEKETPIIGNLLFRNKDKDDFSESIPGAIYKVSLDKGHPLAFGLGNYYYTLKTDDKIYESLSKGYNVGLLGANGYVSGLVGSNVRKKLQSGLLFGVQSYQKGTIIYFATDLLFRSFWENGKQMFINSVFLVN